jgi:crotonobetainyl-CoA:carnitine CoA-transferase CaiB-like acyl-CoA transferase
MSFLLNGGRPPQRSASGIPNPFTGAPYRIYQTSDGHIAIGMNPLNKLARLLGVTGYENITSDNVMENRDAICEDLAKTFVTRTTDEWLTILLAEDIWCAPVFHLTDLEHDPQIAENEMIANYDHPTVGTVRAIGIPIKFSMTPGAVRRPAPLLGEHTADLLKEFGGYSAEEIDSLAESGVFG